MSGPGRVGKSDGAGVMHHEGCFDNIPLRLYLTIRSAPVHLVLSRDASSKSAISETKDLPVRLEEISPTD